jgi:mono/diheme cytochrome c family protein
MNFSEFLCKMGLIQLWRKIETMNKRMISLICGLLLIVLAGTFLASCGTSSTPAATSSAGSASDGQALMQTRCSVCHSTDRITSAHKTADQWKTTVGRMINNGAQINSQEEQVLIDYLAQNYK